MGTDLVDSYQVVGHNQQVEGHNQQVEGMVPEGTHQVEGTDREDNQQVEDTDQVEAGNLAWMEDQLYMALGDEVQVLGMADLEEQRKSIQNEQKHCHEHMYETEHRHGHTSKIAERVILLLYQYSV